MRKNLFLYLIVFLEGYVVLSSELLAIRLITPYVGGATDTTSIVIAAVLLPMAVGYYWGGQYKPKINRKGRYVSVRDKLLKNILISAVILTLGLSYIFIHDFLGLVGGVYYNRLFMTTIYCAVFLIYPVFLLAQTIPLSVNYYSKESISKITGKMLFFSTIGSLFGAVFSTLFLMATIGVHLTATITIITMCVLYFLIAKKRTSKALVFIGLIGVLSYFMNAPSIMKHFDIVESNQYQTIQISEISNGNKILRLNNATSAGISADKQITFAYMDFFEDNYIKPIEKAETKRDILVIGSGGFTLGLNDTNNNYTFVDVDEALLDISEQYFLNQKLGNNKKFYPLPARAYVRKAINEDKHYDLIIVDTYYGSHIPEHLITKEFFESLNNVTKDNGIIAFNFLLNPNFSDQYSINVDTTLRSVFPLISRQIIHRFNAWSEHPAHKYNVAYSFYKNKTHAKREIYTDNKNRVYYDKNKPVN